METAAAYPTAAYPTQPANADSPHMHSADSGSTNVRPETAAGQRMYRLIRRIRCRRLILSNLLASSLIAAVTPLIEGHPFIMRSAAGRE